MAMALTLPQTFKIVTGTTPMTTNAQITCDYVSLKNVHKAWIVTQLNQAAANATTVQPMLATAVAPAGAAAITFAAACWENENVATNDILVKIADTTIYTATADIANKLCVFQIDPSEVVGQVATADCMGCVLSASGELTNHGSVMYYLEERYQQCTPPSAVVD